MFVGPQPVKGKPFTYSTVYNVKKRSWKGGVQVAVELEESQINSLSSSIGFPEWLDQALVQVPVEERPAYQERAQDLFVQALAWCKLDLLLQSGITQNNQCITADTFVAELNRLLSKNGTSSHHMWRQNLISFRTIPLDGEFSVLVGGLQAQCNLL